MRLGLHTSVMSRCNREESSLGPASKGLEVCINHSHPPFLPLFYIAYQHLPSTSSFHISIHIFYPDLFSKFHKYILVQYEPFIFSTQALGPHSTPPSYAHITHPHPTTHLYHITQRELQYLFWSFFISISDCLLLRKPNKGLKP